MKLRSIKNTLLSTMMKIKALPEGTVLLIQSSISALAAALVAVAFLALTNLIFNLTFGWFFHQSLPFFMVASLLTILGTSLAAGLLQDKFSPEAAGSGIPQLKVAYWKDLGYIPFRQVLVKFVAGVLSIGGGTSLGREGPTLFMGAGIASGVAGLLRVPRYYRKGPSVVGASAGLAAAFNTPLAAITFVLEEIVGDINNRAIGRIVLASVIGAFTVFALMGNQPSFLLPGVSGISHHTYLIVPLVALVSALIGVGFQKMTLALRGGLKPWTGVPRWFKPVIGGALTWVIGIGGLLLTGHIGVFGLGYDDLSQVLQGNFFWVAAGILVVAKFFATVFSYGFGGVGGIFSPLLFMGGLTGFFLSGLSGQFLPLSSSDIILLSTVGMSTCLGTVLKAPLSSLLIVFEMTHQFSMVPSLMIGIAISMMVSRMAGHLNFYDALLVQDGHNLLQIHPPRDLEGWRNTCVGDVVKPHPIVCCPLTAPDLQGATKAYPYRRFGIRNSQGNIISFLTKEEIISSRVSGTPPNLSPAVVCYTDMRIRDVEGLFLDNPVGVLLVRNRKTGEEVCVLTLHDLIRVQASLVE